MFNSHSTEKSRKKSFTNQVFQDDYAVLHNDFSWNVPVKFNMADVCSIRWAESKDTNKNVAIYEYSSDRPVKSFTFQELQERANRLSNALKTLGVGSGDRVAIVMPQGFETAVSYIAVMQMGAVAMPLSVLFGPEALAFRLQDSEAVVAIGDRTSLEGLNSIRSQCPHLKCILGLGEEDIQFCADLDYSNVLSKAENTFISKSTSPEDPAVLIYTSGTTGNPKGALIPHRALIGNLTGFICSQNWFGFSPKKSTLSKAIFWSPADWAWTGGLMDALLPTLYFGRPIVAFSGRFSPEAALTLMRDMGVTHTFLFPTALKAMMKSFPGSNQITVRDHFKLKLQSIMSAGEAVGDAVFLYGQRQLGVTINEMFGQTEVNYIVGNCAMQSKSLKSGTKGGFGGWPARPGSMGKGYPGHRVSVINENGIECKVGVPGEVAVNRLDAHGFPDPIFFLGYWKNKNSTDAKYTRNWFRTGDLAIRDKDGYLWYQGRSDDVFKAAGYRIGPGEIENCLVKHPAVANAAVVPKPDLDRGALVKAYVVLSPEYMFKRDMQPDEKSVFENQLIVDLQIHVKGKLAPYEYPKEIEFVDALPMTTTGKVQRRVLRLQEEARARDNNFQKLTSIKL